MEQFWHVTVGNIGSVVAIVGALWHFHQENVKRIQEDARAREQMSTKIDLMFAWFQENVFRGGMHSGIAHGDD